MADKMSKQSATTAPGKKRLAYRIVSHPFERILKFGSGHCENTPRDAFLNQVDSGKESPVNTLEGVEADRTLCAGNPGEWQTYDVTLVGRMVIVVQNGVTSSFTLAVSRRRTSLDTPCCVRP